MQLHPMRRDAEIGDACRHFYINVRGVDTSRDMYTKASSTHSRTDELTNCDAPTSLLTVPAC